ncbi:MAG: DinB family protein [Planctomycetota bacterium]|nr:DinB family protein [Planctomycetota bacterium]
MNADALIASLSRFPETLVSLIRGLVDEEVRWKPTPSQWSILEIVRHLGDEEVDDFRQRLFMTLEDPKASWPTIDPEGWAKERQYNEDDLGPALERFAEERAKSIAMLESAVSGVSGVSGGALEWDASHQHASLGEITAGDLLASWTVHDLLHLRQITKCRYQLIKRHAGSFRSGYAGEWKE